MQIDVWELKKLLDAGSEITLLDVREPAELEMAKLKNCVNIPLRVLEFELDLLPRDQRIVTICHHGVRSLTACGILNANGIYNVQSLEGGLDRWAKTIDSNMATY